MASPKFQYGDFVEIRMRNSFFLARGRVIRSVYDPNMYGDWIYVVAIEGPRNYISSWEEDSLRLVSEPNDILKEVLFEEV